VSENALREPLARVLERAPASWQPTVEAWRVSPAGCRLVAFIEQRQAAGATIYPAAVLRALEMTPLEAVRVVILGQDPYHGPDQAEGLAFSVPAGQRLPPSLRNIGRELARDLGVPLPTSGHLGGWARQGVLLINTTLTVEDGRPAAHANRGWEVLTDEIVKACSSYGRPKVFLLWGAHAQAKAGLAGAAGRHTVLMSNHPSPLSAGRAPRPFIGCGHFGTANRVLEARGEPPVDWQLP
jgi:uracil-DNA glycosylase